MGAGASVMDLLSDHFDELGKMSKRDQVGLEEKFKKLLLEGDKTPAEVSKLNRKKIFAACSSFLV